MNILQKTHKKSFFRKFQNGSPLAKALFSNSPHMVGDNYPGKTVVVLQLMPTNDDGYIVEVVWEEDFKGGAACTSAL